jgi:hypothetical protein
MARTKGDTNYSTREHRLIAQAAVLKAKIRTLQEKIKVKNVRIKELRSKV